MPEEKTGNLVSIGRKPIHEFFECVDCKSAFPVIDGTIRCNGAIITLCPWCRPDSKPWTNGRGE